MASHLPDLDARIDGRPAQPARGVIGLPNHLRASSGPGGRWWATPAYHRDPITGYGISDAFRDADLLAGAIDEVLAGEDEAVALARYEQRRITLLTPLLDVACQMIRFPGRDHFRGLQIRLADLIDAESAVLAARPTPLRLAARSPGPLPGPTPRPAGTLPRRCGTASATTRSTRARCSSSTAPPCSTSSRRCSTCSRTLRRTSPRVVPKTELLDEVWGEPFVSESALTTRIKQARQGRR